MEQKTTEQLEAAAYRAHCQLAMWQKVLMNLEQEIERRMTIEEAAKKTVPPVPPAPAAKAPAAPVPAVKAPVVPVPPPKVVEKEIKNAKGNKKK